MGYLREPEPVYGVASEVIPGVRRIVARNPGPMTYHGTNTYLVEAVDGLVIIDPGPDDPDHLAAITAAAAGRAKGILLSHGHYDHCAGSDRLAGDLGIPAHGFHPFDSRVATPDHALAEGDRIAGMTVLHTPGHARDHVCFARDDGVLFTGDQVMAWSSSVVPFPSGDMAAFIGSLERLRDRNDRFYLAGHGPALSNPSTFIDDLIASRLRRERAILGELGRGGDAIGELTRRLYAKRGASLFKAAEHNVRSHLHKLLAEGLVETDGENWRATGAV